MTDFFSGLLRKFFTKNVDWSTSSAVILRQLLLHASDAGSLNQFLNILCPLRNLLG